MNMTLLAAAGMPPAAAEQGASLPPALELRVPKPPTVAVAGDER